MNLEDIYVYIYFFFLKYNSQISILDPWILGNYNGSRYNDPHAIVIYSEYNALSRVISSFNLSTLLFMRILNVSFRKLY